jgi:predicted nucleotidyltransferase
MDLPADSVELIQQWAARTNSVREVWLFGSRAKGTSRPGSDIDLGIYLMPPTGGSNWALALYTAEGDAWQRELAGLLGQRVSLEAVIPGAEDMRKFKRASYSGHANDRASRRQMEGPT